MLLRSSLALPAMFVLACSGDSGGGGTGATGVGGTNGGGLPGNAPTTLSGTWTGRAEGATGEPGVTIVISGSQFSMRVYNGALDVNAEGEGFHARILEDDGQASDEATVSRKSPEIGNLGAIPLPLAGGLRVQGAEAGQFCQSTLVDGGVTANCGEVDAGYIMPRRASKGTAAGTRTARASSIFGDLGGTWTVQLSGGGTCNASFVGATFTASCTRASTFTGSVTISFEGNRATGSTSEGTEFVAVRQ